MKWNTILCILCVFEVHAIKTVKRKVIILGAGISGAASARTLSKHGIRDYIVLEAQNVIGGRLKQIPFAGIKVEEGGNWFEAVGGSEEGGTENPLWNFAKSVNLTTIRDDAQNGQDAENVSVIIGEAGELIDPKVSDQFDQKLELATEMIAERKKNGLEDISLRVALSLVGWKPMSALDDLLEYKGIEEEFAGNVDTISATYGLLTGSEFGDQSHLVVDQRGYKFIPEQLFAKANATKKIVFNAIVKNITYDKNSVTVTVANGDVYKADYLISTVSLGVLQHDVITFNPPLPDWKREALAKFRMDTYTKIFLNFNTQFWDDNPYTYYASNQKGFYPNWKNFMAPGFLSNIIPKGNYVCMVTLTNAQSRRIERLSDKEVEDEIMLVLADMYPGKNIPRPTEIHVPRWGINPFFFGSFSNWPIGMSIESWKNLVAPLNNRVFFGGEMASVESYGYVHGGYQAGINTGLDIIACIKGKCKKKKSYPNGLKVAVQQPVLSRRRSQE
ncbi:hypothetical protein BC833DRAFT_530040 [Globomyces pollinis-pini]|nr:hypothetical protein BC833DRAFT_530040 [Globomyces pollinis-pini]